MLVFFNTVKLNTSKRCTPYMKGDMQWHIVSLGRIERPFGQGNNQSHL